MSPFLTQKNTARESQMAQQPKQLALCYLARAVWCIAGDFRGDGGVCQSSSETPPTRCARHLPSLRWRGFWGMVHTIHCQKSLPSVSWGGGKGVSPRRRGRTSQSATQSLPTPQPQPPSPQEPPDSQSAPSSPHVPRVLLCALGLEPTLGHQNVQPHQVQLPNAILGSKNPK
jgi:hypothetical protein